MAKAKPVQAAVVQGMSKWRKGTGSNPRACHVAHVRPVTLAVCPQSHSAMSDYSVDYIPISLHRLEPQANRTSVSHVTCTHQVRALPFVVPPSSGLTSPDGSGRVVSGWRGLRRSKDALESCLELPLPCN